MKHETYGPGGWLPDQPFGNLSRVADDEARVVTDYSTGEAVERPYTDDENAEADTRAAADGQ